MKLNHDCIRSLLLYLEDNLSYENQIVINNLNFDNYSKEDLIYCSDKLIEANYLIALKTHNITEDGPIIIVKSITYSGHLFLDNIRDEEVFKKTKKILSKLKSVSIEIFSETASKVITNLIDQQFNLS